MDIQETRSRIISSIWQAFAQSRVDLSSISPDQVEKLVGKIAENMLLTLDEVLGEQDENVEPEPKQNDEFSEMILWQGRPFLSIVEHITLTSERLKIVRGLFGRDTENFELIRVQDIDLKQHLGERMMGVGDISIRGSDLSKSDIVLRNIRDPEKVYEVLRRAWLEARKRHGLQFREYM